MVGPYHNPQETYSYYILPFCKGTEVVDHRHETLGEALLGYELVNSGIGMKFKEPVKPKPICSVTLDASAAHKFKYAVLNSYWSNFFLDDLPLWAMVGEVVESADGKEESAFVYTHKRFAIAYNGRQIIEVNLTSENPEPIAAGVDLTFTYSLEWVETAAPFETRFDRYLDNGFFMHQIHWFSIFNSFMLVVFLVGVVTMILMRTLKRDFARYAPRDDDDDFDMPLGDDSGWKQVYGDVFRPPPRLILFAALLGTGYQLVILVFAVLSLAWMGTLYATRGTVLTTAIFVYAMTSLIAGYFSGSYYAQQQGERWIVTMIATAALFPGVCFATSFALNAIAIAYQSLAAIPVMTMVAVFFIWAFIAFPLTLVGTLVGRNLAGTRNVPCKPKAVARHIPVKPWYLEPLVLIHVGGVLPFGSIFIEAFFIFTSLSSHRVYYVYGFLALVCCILVIVTMCVSTVVTYLTLNAEDFRWQWLSFLASASTGGYVLLYSVYYFVFKTRMTGLFQTSFFFANAALGSLAVAIICGACGYTGASLMVWNIYASIKVD
eukprot:a174436_467.p1 GENE.a174436_467~~a174436_467.p1  ORF type:complete len:600 (-),score=303.55 a174436_467:25-1665(-)